jgi:hypothetical protein
MLPDRFASGWRLGLGLLCVVAATGLAPAAQAQDTDSWRFSGFGTLGLTDMSTPNGWGYRRDLGQSGSNARLRGDVDSRLGVQVNYTLSTQVEFVAQVLAARSSPDATEGDRVEWAFAALHPTPQIAVRLGRINLDAFLMSDHRQVGFAYLPARPPVEFYGLLPTTLDGGDVARWFDVDDARWRLKLFTGRSEGGDRGARFGVRVSPVYGGSVTRESGGLLLRLGLTRAGIPNAPAVLAPLISGLAGLGTLPVPSVAAEAQALRQRVDGGGSTVNYLAMGVRYESGPWLWSAEAAKVSGHPFFDLAGGYVNAGRRFGDWTAYAVYSQVRSAAATVAMPKWAASLAFNPVLAAQAQALGTAAAMTANVGRPRQRNLAVGARWDLHPQMSLKFQWDEINTDAEGASLWTQSTAQSAKSHLASVLLDFVF